eukprot:scaffold392193_cov14-Prasinocladus_malaysianus.AAC.1
MILCIAFTPATWRDVESSWRSRGNQIGTRTRTRVCVFFSHTPYGCTFTLKLHGCSFTLKLTRTCS